MWGIIDGYKTYLVAAAVGIAGVLYGLGKISQDQFNQFAAVTIPMALAFLRHAVEKSKTP